MTSAESLAVAEKLFALLRSAASLGMTATLNLESRNGRIFTTFTCEESRVSDGKPCSNSGKKKQKSNGSIKRSKSRLIRYQEGKKKDMEMDKDFRRNRSDEKDKGKPTESIQVAKENKFCSGSILVCDKCNYKCTRSETLAKHVNTTHINQIIKESKCQSKKKDVVCPVCKSDLKNFSLLIGHMHDSHVDNEKD